MEVLVTLIDGRAYRHTDTVLTIHPGQAGHSNDRTYVVVDEDETRTIYPIYNVRYITERT